MSDLYKSSTNLDDWILCGDFNIISYTCDKMGGNQIDYFLANSFLDTLNKCKLNELNFNGDPFTWSNNQLGDDHIHLK